jgi:nucleoid-associated protein YgaU
MEIWLKQDDEELRLPILPSEVGMSMEQDNKTETVNAKGEVNLLGLPKLGTVQIESHFPANEMYYDQYKGYPEPVECVELIKQMKRNGVIQLIITPIIDCKATIEQFEYKYQDGTEDIYFTLQLKRYKKIKKRSTKKYKQVSVTVKKGDTWAKLAKKYTGSSSNAKKIAKQNGMGNKKTPPIGKKVVIKP